MFGIGMPELIVILLVALVVLGPKRLPEVARTIGKALAEFRRQTSDVMQEFETAARLEEAGRRRTTKPPAGSEPRGAQAPAADPAPAAPVPPADKPTPGGA